MFDWLCVEDAWWRVNFVPLKGIVFLTHLMAACLSFCSFNCRQPPVVVFVDDFLCFVGSAGSQMIEVDAVWFLLFEVRR